jgi:hypothetical protein
MTAGSAQAHRAGVYRVDWMPGTDHLLGECFCGAQQVSAEPAPLWSWLFAHPDGHDPGPGPSLPVAGPVTAEPTPAGVAS